LYQTKHEVIEGLVVLGTTSESPTLSKSEQLALVKFIWEINNASSHPVFIVAGLGGNCTADTLDNALMLQNYCDGFMLTVPAYNKPTQLGIEKHFEVICGHSELVKKTIYNL